MQPYTEKKTHACRMGNTASDRKRVSPLTYCVLALLILFMVNASAQQAARQINQVVLQNYFEDYRAPRSHKRALLKSNTKADRVNPLHYVSAGLLYLYQNTISEQIQANCQYEISCSENMKRSIQQYGLIKGILVGINQLNNCAHSVLQDYPAYKITPRNTIKNSIE